MVSDSEIFKRALKINLKQVRHLGIEAHVDLWAHQYFLFSLPVSPANPLSAMSQYLKMVFSKERPPSLLSPSSVGRKLASGH